MKKTYVIRATRHFYGKNPVRNLVTGDSCNPLIFRTACDARAYIVEAESEVYHTAHNEFGRPEYKVIASDNLPNYLANQL